MTLDEVNILDPMILQRELLRCCGSRRWAEKMTAARPFVSIETMLITSDVIWLALDRGDWLEAFAAHPEIGAGRTPVDGEMPGARSWSAQEQSGVAFAASTVRARLAAKNREYRSRFGYIFIVCATGKSADDMLHILEQRLTNDPTTELRVAADEQRKITRLRIAKLVGEAAAS